MRNKSGIHPDLHHHGLPATGEELLYFFGEGRETAVVTYHQEGSQTFVFLRLVGAANFLELFAIDGQRFFHQHRSVIGQRGHDVAGMTVVAGEDEYDIGILVLQQFGRGHSSGKTKQPARGFRCHARGGRNRVQSDTATLSQRRK